jgi:type II secretory pathway component PulM
MSWIKSNASALVAATVAIVTLLITIGSIWAQSETTAATVKEHETRLRHLEQLAPMIQETRRDVREIRRHLIGSPK